MSGTASQTQVAPPLPYLPPKVEIALTGDALMALAIGGWLIWDKLLKNRVVTKLDGVFAPIEEERKLNNILAQIGVVTHASRVVLCAFHNGAIDTAGYHLTKLSTVNSYVAPGKSPMAVPIRDLPVGRIMFELEELLSAQDGPAWTLTEYREDLPQACRDHLNRNEINQMWNRLIRVGNLPIGILSLQYDKAERRRPPFREHEYTMVLEDLYEQIALIMRRRIVHPGPIKKILMRLRGGSQASPN